MRSLTSKARGRLTSLTPGASTVEELRAEVDRMRRLNRRLLQVAARLEGSEAPSRPSKPKGKTRVPIPADFDDEARATIELIRPYTMTSHEKLFALICATRHIAEAGVPGDVVECGVWRGGSMHAVALTLHEMGVQDRELYLFDTFTGMTEPTERDVRIGEGKTAAEMLQTSDKTAKVWAVASLEDVREGLQTLPYPQERFHLVEGPVEETIPDAAPARIALLRLDTDWYESTRHELEHLYDRLEPGGVLIIDDYGSWQGAREATDEFLAKLDRRPFMLRAGRSRIGLKPVP